MFVCYWLNACVLQNCQKVTSNLQLRYLMVVVSLGGDHLIRVEPSWMGLVPYKCDTKKLPCPSTMLRHDKKTVIYKPERKISPSSHPPELWGSSSIVYKLLSLCYCCSSSPNKLRHVMLYYLSICKLIHTLRSITGIQWDKASATLV